MTKRINRQVGIGILGLLLGISLFSGAVESPAVTDPADVASSNRSTLLKAIWTLESVLIADLPLSAQQMSRLVWSDQDVVEFVAGFLASQEYEVLLAEGADSLGTQITWILVGVPVADGVFWIPVSAALTGASRVAAVAWADGYEDARFDTAYKVYEQVSDLPANTAPTVAFANTYTNHGTIIDAITSFLALGQDVGGRIVAYQWIVDDEDPVITEVASYRYTFTVPGEHTVELTVFDNGGAHTTVRLTLEVYTERQGCNC